MNAPAPSHVAWARPLGTGAPRRIVGRASIGRAKIVAVLMSDEAVRAVPTRVGSKPDCVSMRYCNAPPAAAPPGTIRLNAFPASCAVAIASHRLVPRAMRTSAHWQAKLAPSAAIMTTIQIGLIVNSCGQAENSFSSPGQRM